VEFQKKSKRSSRQGRKSLVKLSVLASKLVPKVLQNWSVKSQFGYSSALKTLFEIDEYEIK
jgi:hypothetical protein